MRGAYNSACVVNVRAGEDHGTCCGILLDSQAGLVLSHASCLAPYVEKGYLDLDSPSLLYLKGLDCDVFLQRMPEARDNDSFKSRKRLCQVPVSTWNNDVTDRTQNDDLRDYAENVSGSTHTNDNVDSTANTQNANATPFYESEDKFQSSTSHFEKLNAATTFHAYSKFSARLVAFFQCHAVAKSLEKLMPDTSWELGDRRNDTSSHSGRNKSSFEKDSLKLQDGSDKAKLEESLNRLVGCFVLLQIKHWAPYPSTLVIRSARESCIGDRVEVCSTPFGGLKPDVFFNSYSRGIISNLAGKDNCLLLSDARCILGGEGAPLYTFQHNIRCLTGVIIASLSWKNDEWVGFCVAADIGSVVQSLPSNYTHPHLHPALLPTPTGSNFQGSRLHHGVLSPEVVLLEVGPTWGSGVVVDEKRGVILTCSHVIKDAHLYSVHAKRQGGQGCGRVEVLFRHHPVHTQFDLALVRGCQWKQPCNRLSSTVDIGKAEEGMEVYVVGHALFGPEHGLQPSVTSGVVSKVISINNIPVMIQTTCAVHPGASGGALVDTRGRLLGIVVCNAKDVTTGASFPHVNMSIPLSTVWPVIDKYLKTGDKLCLYSLAVKNHLLEKIWSLQATQPAASIVPKVVSRL